MKKADDRQPGARYNRHHQYLPGDIIHPWEIAATNCSDDDDGQPLNIGLFRGEERAMFSQEILQQVVIGMGRLDVDFAPQPGSEQTMQPQIDISPPASMMDNNNPYFPPLPSNLPSQSPSHVSVHHPPPTFHEVSPALLRPPPSSGNAYSPGTEFPPDVDRPPATSPRTPIAYERSLGSSPSSNSNSGPPGSPMNMDVDW